MDLFSSLLLVTEEGRTGAIMSTAEMVLLALLLLLLRVVVMLMLVLVMVVSRD